MLTLFYLHILQTEKNTLWRVKNSWGWSDKLAGNPFTEELIQEEEKKTAVVLSLQTASLKPEELHSSGRQRERAIYTERFVRVVSVISSVFPNMINYFLREREGWLCSDPVRAVLFHFLPKRKITESVWSSIALWKSSWTLLICVMVKYVGRPKQLKHKCHA